MKLRLRLGLTPSGGRGGRFYTPKTNGVPEVIPLRSLIGLPVTRKEGTYTSHSDGQALVIEGVFQLDGVDVGGEATYTPQLGTKGQTFTYSERAYVSGHKDRGLVTKIDIGPVAFERLDGGGVSSIATYRANGGSVTDIPSTGVDGGGVSFS